MARPAVDKQRTQEEKYEEAAIELAVYRLLIEERDKAAKPLDDETEKLLQEQYEHTLPQRMAMIDRETRRRALIIGVRNCAPRILKIAATVILLLNMGLTIAIASNSATRAYLMEFFVKVNDEYAEIGFYKTETSVTIPDRWTGNCYPTYIPEGFSIIQVVPDKVMSSVLYIDPNDRKLSFELYNMAARVNIDAENARMSCVTVQGVKSTVFEKDGKVTLVFPYGEQFVILHIEGTLSEIVAVAASIRAIKN